MSEFAFSGIGLNPHWGTPGNAADPDRVPGGSTSGGAVSVGLDIAELTLGSDTGGSTRIPQPLMALLASSPHPSAFLGTVRSRFPIRWTRLVRWVEHCGLCAMDAVLAGIEPVTLPTVSLKGLRLGVPRGLLFEETETPVSVAFEAALEHLERAGAQITEVPLDDLILRMRGLLAKAPIVACETAEIHAEWLESRAADFDGRVLARIRPGVTVPASAYIAALRGREMLKSEFADRIAGFDSLVLPTCPLVAPLRAPLEADVDLFARNNVLALRNTSIGNFFDCPAVSLPLPVSGLPIGLMLMGRPMDDRQLYAISAAVEALLGG